MDIGELVIALSDDAIIGISHTGKTFEFNKAAEKILGINKSEIYDKNLFVTCREHTIDLPFDIAMLENSIGKETKLTDGIIRFAAHKSPVKWKSIFSEQNKQNHSYFLIIIRIVYDPYLDEIMNHQISLRTILENLPEYIYWKDKNLVYQGCNKHVAEYLGLSSPSDIIGKTDYSFGWKKERIRTLHEIDEQVIKEGIKIAVEDVIPKPDGSQRTMISSKSPLLNTNGKVMGILGVSVDITNLKELEEKLRANEARFKAMSALGGMIAHELRTPLTGLGMSAIVYL